jgi:pimeloyl-ACP methyl ester carboxylesterase
VYFKDANKLITLRGWYFTTPQNTKTVILSHGYGKNRFNFEEQSLEMIKKFLSRGYNVLAFDLRNSGKSDGKQFTLGYYERDDLLGAISYIRSQGIQKISLMGFSTGANAALLAAGQKISEVDAVIADTPYYSSEEFLQDAIFRITRLPSFPFSRFTSLAMNMFTGIKFTDIDMSKVLARVSSKPFMMIYSSRDAIIPADDSKKLFAAYKNAQGVSGQLWETTATGHAESYLENPETYMDNVLKFLDNIYIESPKK